MRNPTHVLLAVVAFIVVLLVLAKGKPEHFDSPVVDLLVLTIVIFAIAALVRFVAIKGNAPGIASFFGGATAA